MGESPHGKCRSRVMAGLGPAIQSLDAWLEAGHYPHSYEVQTLRN
jgi:hypothetical protein